MTNIETIAESLSNASSVGDVEGAMNMIILPDKDSDAFQQYKTLLYPVFEKIVVKNGLTNKQLRRRMERMMFVLHDGEKKRVLPVIDRSAFEYKPKSNKSYSSPKISLLHESFVAFINLTKRDDITANDIDEGLDKIGAIDSDSTIDGDIKQHLIQALEVLGDNEKLGLNSKLRRRVKRMAVTIESLALHKSISSDITSNTFKEPKKITIEQHFVAFINLTKRDDITANDIDEGLDKIGAIDSDSTIDGDIKQQLIQALEVLGDNEKLGLNSKLRRRVKRMVLALHDKNDSTKRQKIE